MALVEHTTLHGIEVPTSFPLVLLRITAENTPEVGEVWLLPLEHRKLGRHKIDVPTI
jgi:hypothetical protein